MALHTIDDTADLAIHRYPSAALFRAIRGNLLALDAATRIGRNAYCGGFGHPQEYVNLNPYRESWGAFRALPSLTTLTWVTRTTGLLGPQSMRVYLDGTLATTRPLTNGLQTHTLGLGGYAINRAIEVQFDVIRTDQPEGDLLPNQFGMVEIEDAFASPVALPDPWPGTPTFTTVYDPLLTRQLADAIDWLIRLVGRRTDPLFQALVRWNGPYTGQAAVDMRWYGSVQPQPAAPTVRAMGTVWVQAPATEQIRLWVNGTVVQTFAVPTAPGMYAYQLSATLAQPAGSHVPVAVDYIRTAGPPLVRGAEPINRWAVWRVWTEGAQGLYPIPSIPAPAARTPTSSWRDALNAASAAAAAIKSRIDANPDLWTRQRLFRRRYAYDGYQDRVFEPGNIAVSQSRVGEAVLVRGQNDRIEWGPHQFDEIAANQNEVGLYPLAGPLRQAICQRDQVVSELAYLSNLPGLYPTSFFAVRGETLAYAGEVWRVGTDIS